MLGGELQVQRSIGDIAQHGTGRCIFARAASIEQGIAHDIAANEDRVEHMTDTGENVRVGDQRRIDRDLDARAVLSLFFA